MISKVFSRLDGLIIFVKFVIINRLRTPDGGKGHSGVKHQQITPDLTTAHYNAKKDNVTQSHTYNLIVNPITKPI